MDIENGYFLASFRNKLDCENVLSKGPWIIFLQYLTVQPWSLFFNSAQNYPSSVMYWIRLPGLSSYFYKKFFLKEIGGLIRRVAKLDMNTDNKARGRFARMAVYVNLDKPLISHIYINGKAQRVEYEFLPTVCFHCGKYSHLKEGCPQKAFEPEPVKENTLVESMSDKVTVAAGGESKTDDSYGPWMLVE